MEWTHITNRTFLSIILANLSYLVMLLRYSDEHVSLKAPTTVLINPDGETLDSFGYDAETRYSELASKDKHRDYFYFKHFKMMLDGRQV